MIFYVTERTVKANFKQEKANSIQIDCNINSLIQMCSISVYTLRFPYYNAEKNRLNFSNEDFISIL